MRMLLHEEVQKYLHRWSVFMHQGHSNKQDKVTLGPIFIGTNSPLEWRQKGLHDNPPSWFSGHPEWATDVGTGCPGYRPQSGQAETFAKCHYITRRALYEVLSHTQSDEEKLWIRCRLCVSVRWKHLTFFFFYQCLAVGLPKWCYEANVSQHALGYNTLVSNVEATINVQNILNGSNKKQTRW